MYGTWYVMHEMPESIYVITFAAKAQEFLFQQVVFWRNIPWGTGAVSFPINLAGASLETLLFKVFSLCFPRIVFKQSNEEHSGWERIGDRQQGTSISNTKSVIKISVRCNLVWGYMGVYVKDK